MTLTEYIEHNGKTRVPSGKVNLKDGEFTKTKTSNDSYSVSVTIQDETYFYIAVISDLYPNDETVTLRVDDGDGNPQGYSVFTIPKPN